MNVALDHESPVPLYHQLAETLRYRIATGEIAAGDVLPPLRRAAERWGVNLHTVRQAYTQLARDGVVVTSTPGGTRVRPGRESIGGSKAAALRSRQVFAEAVACEARLRHGLDVDGLIALLRGAPAPAEPQTVAVVECSRTQCEDLAGQLEHAWRLRAVPWVLGQSEPPPGPIVATYFHYNEIRRSWPARVPEVCFLPIVPEAALATRLLAGGRRGKTLLLCERDEAMARNIAADLMRILPPSAFRIAVRVVASADDELAQAGPTARILLSPRMWGELSEAGRRDPRVMQVRYVFEEGALSALAAQKEWSPK